MNDWAEILHFRYLVEIMKRGGVRPAAEFLHTSPPNLCTQANEFQEHFNIHLYQKGADGRLSYTETGVAFLAIAPALLESFDDAITALIAIEAGKIRTCDLEAEPLSIRTCFAGHVIFIGSSSPVASSNRRAPIPRSSLMRLPPGRSMRLW